MRVAWLGLGLMGSRMAANLVAKGFAVTVWNRTASKADPLRARGAAVATSPREAVLGADVVCTNLADAAAIDAILTGSDGLLAGLRAGQTWVDFSTLAPATTKRLAALCGEKGAAFIEAPVTGSKAGAEAGTLVLMCGGPQATFDAMQPLFDAVGRKAIRCGEVGSGAQVKLVGNTMIAHMLQGLGEGAALLRKAGIPLETLLEVVQSSGYASPYWEFKGKALAARDFEQHFSVDLMHKDLTLALETGRAHGVPMPGTATIREVYQLARTQGLGQQDIVATAAVMDPALVERKS